MDAGIKIYTFSFRPLGLNLLVEIESIDKKNSHPRKSCSPKFEELAQRSSDRGVFFLS